jgi:hypothetical protein
MHVDELQLALCDCADRPQPCHGDRTARADPFQHPCLSLNTSQLTAHMHTHSVCQPVYLFCRVRLIALDGFTFGVKLGSVNHRLRVADQTTRFGAAAPEASEEPLDLRLRCIKVRGTHRVCMVCTERASSSQGLVFTHRGATLLLTACARWVAVPLVAGVQERQALREEAERVCQQKDAEVAQLQEQREQLQKTEAAAQQECEAAAAEQQRNAAELQQVQQELHKVQQAAQQDERQRRR